MKQLVLKSPAKLNLYLKVSNKRRDGFHNLKTVFEKIDLCDKIILRPRLNHKIRLICKNPHVPKDETNLAYKAARLLKEDMGVDQGIDIKIIKNIPVASGLGGGSSNAACVLLGLNQLWNLKLSRQKLLFYARKLGADVPFFLYDLSFAQGKARGDLIKPILAVKRSLWHVLVVPYIRLETHFIYNNLDKIRSKRLTRLATSRVKKSPSVSTLPRTECLFVPSARQEVSTSRSGKAGMNVLTKKSPDVKILLSGLRLGGLSLVKQGLFNQLEEVSLKICPKIQQIKEEFLNLGIDAISMSGKGPAVFGIVSSRKEGEKVKRLLGKLSLGKVYVVKTKITRLQQQRWLRWR